MGGDGEHTTDDEPGRGRQVIWRAVGAATGLLFAFMVAFFVKEHRATTSPIPTKSASSSKRPVMTAPGTPTKGPGPNAAVVKRLAAGKGVEVNAAKRMLGDSKAIEGDDPTATAPWRIDENDGRSIGTPQDGRLEGGGDVAARPAPAMRVLDKTQRRGFTHGTSELIALLADTSAAVARAFPGAVMAIGNLSRPGGGDIPQSVSHNSGRDADIAFYALDDRGKPITITDMMHFDDQGFATGPDGRRLRFDPARNWTLVHNLLSHPAVVVQWIFVSAALRNMLLDHALRVKAPDLVRERARRVLVQPSDSSRHDDHFHVRIACPSADRPHCINGSGRTKLAREAQIDALLAMYHRGSPAEKRYARDMLSLPDSGEDLVLPPLESAADAPKP